MRTAVTCRPGPERVLRQRAGGRAGLTAPLPHPLRYYACLCGHEELVLYLLANGECRVGTFLHPSGVLSEPVPDSHLRGPAQHLPRAREASLTGVKSRRASQPRLPRAGEPGCVRAAP